MEWSIFHRYRNLVNDEKAQPIRCPDDDTPLITRVRNQDDEPWFWCPVCYSFTKPGLRVYDQMRAVVSEHFME